MTQIEKIANKIKALMAKARDNAATPAEAESAMQKAHELITKYNISVASLKEDKEISEKESMGFHPWNQRWQKEVWTAVAKLCFCRFYFVGNATDDHEFFLIGRKSNRITAMELAKYVVEVGNKAALEYAQNNEGNSVSLSNSFKKGYARTINKRCFDIVKNAEKTDTAAGSALVVQGIYKETDMENDLIADKIGLRPNTSKENITDHVAFMAGNAKAAKVPLNTQVGAQHGKQLLIGGK